VRETLAKIRANSQRPEEKYFPSFAVVGKIMAAAGTEDEQAVYKALYHLHSQRGLVWGSETGPHSWKWFETTLADYFSREQARYDAAHPAAEDVWDKDGTRL
jgi:hypothetical protein